MNKLTVLLSLGLGGFVVGSTGAAAGTKEPLPYRESAKMPDAAELLSPADVRLEGFLGERVANNEKNRLLKVDLEPLLAGFRKKPGVHPWIGEHIGKWLHAATLAWVYTGDPELRAKMDYAVAELAKAQEVDGYLGTYTPDKRFGLHRDADWDVWSHKYDLIGLLTYYQYTGNPLALEVSRKIGDLLIATFGPGRKSILSAGTHVGMAATSVLEPVVLLYRNTGDDRYLEFARYLVSSWDEPNGPKIIATLSREKSVAKTANGKAYEMLSNLVGLCELARATGERRYLDPAIIAWDDIVAHRLYLTGSASQGEHFHADYELPNDPKADLCETCVTVTWLQLTSQLLRLTGEARFGDQLEKTLYNNLAAAQRPDGAEWCYFTALEGTKPYGPGINCCVSSGPRGMALTPQLAYLTIPESGNQPAGLAVNLFEKSSVTTRLGGQNVTVIQDTQFPGSGSTTLAVKSGAVATFALRVRTPAWAQPLVLNVNGQHSRTAAVRNGWTIVPARRWRNGDRVEIGFNLSARMVPGDHSNAGRAALMWGPFVLACDEKANPGLEASGLLGLVATPGKPPFTLEAGKTWRFLAEVRSARDPKPRLANFDLFANAGSDGGRYEVWLRAPGVD